MSTTTIRLEEELKLRLAAVAMRLGKSPHALILDSIAKMVEQVELDDDFHRVADERWAEFLVTGETVSWDEARAYLKARAYGQPTARPVPKKR